MKTLLLASLILSTSAFAQAVRPCTSEKLVCDVWEELPTGGKVVITSASAVFDGMNYDEPSIEPDQCTLNLNVEGKDGLIFNVTIGDSDYLADVYAVKRPNLGSLYGSDAAFPVVKNKNFYFRADHQILQCKLF